MSSVKPFFVQVFESVRADEIFDIVKVILHDTGKSTNVIGVANILFKVVKKWLEFGSKVEKAIVFASDLSQSVHVDFLNY